MLKSQIESLLFVSAKAISVKQLSGLLKKKEKEVEEACEFLLKEYNERDGGIKIIKNGKKYQMVSAPENAGIIQKFTKSETTGELSRPALETLTIIAYRGPISKADLNRIRGVNCSLILRNLLLRSLIEAKEEKDDVYYVVSLDFLKYLGINNIKDLPDYEKLSKDSAFESALSKDSD